MLLTDLFDAHLQGRRDDIALEFVAGSGRPVEYTFGELDARACRLARALERRGLQPGDRLAVQLPNSVEFIDLFLACLRLGVIFVPVNVLYREREVAHIVADAQPRLFVARQPTSGTDATELATIDGLCAEAAGCDGSPFRRPLSSSGGDGDVPAALVYTSGTTGRSKGAILTHNNFAVNALNVVGSWAITAADRYLGVLPLFHVHGLGNGVCAWLTSGCRMRLAERFEAERAAELFESFRPTLFFGVPTMYVRLLELDPAAARRIGERARLFVSGSAPLPAHVHEAFRARFGHTILERYGMSETLMNIGNPYSGERRPGTVGLPFPGVSVRIVDAQGAPVGAGAVGELQLRGSNVFQGYWRNPQATAAAFVDGWFRTGDMGERSADGWYTLRGRASDLIISGGFNIYPREIEEVLLEQPGVREAAVVGVADAKRGELPVAYLVTDGEIDEARLREACARALASFKTPRAFVRVGALPRTALGKVQKHLLPAWSPG
ncbi:MAG: AMP-binding protein [Steroidobacteraceae bacterium]